MRIHLLPSKDKDAISLVKKWILAFLLITFFLHIWRIFSLNATYDQGLFLQEIWNGLYGRPFESTLASELSAPVLFDGELPQVGYKHLAQHFTPLLAAWIPLVGILGIWALPVIQVGLIGMAGWVLFLLAKEYLPLQLSGWIACSFFVSAPVVGPSLENFHDLCAVPLLFFSLLLGICKNNKILYLIPALLLPLVREDVGLISFGIGLWMIFRVQNWRLYGIGLCLYSVIYVLIITNNVMPLFGSELSRRFMQERFRQYLHGQEGGTLDVLIAMASQPLLLIKELFSPPISTFRFLLTLALPLAIIPWLSIDSWLLIMLPLFVALSSRGGNAMAVSLRFTLYLVPGVFAGVIYWWRDKIDLFYNKSFRRFWKTCIIVAFIFTVIGNPHRSLSSIIPDSVEPWVYVPIHKSFQRGIETRQLLSYIPKEVSIAAETQLIPQLAQRRLLFRFPENYQYKDTSGEIKNVEYIISQPRYNAVYSIGFDREAQWTQKSIKLIKDLVESNQYGIILCDKRGLILRSDFDSSDESIKCFSNEFSYASNILERRKKSF